MTTSIKLKETYEVESKQGAFYTGGNIQWHENILYCQNISSVSVFNIESGTVTAVVGEENGEDSDILQTFAANGEKIVTSHKSGLLKLWNRYGTLEKMWKYIHKGPIAKLLLNDIKLASGGSDSIIRIWDLQHQACILSLKGSQGVINVVEFHPSYNLIFGSGDDGKINSWNLEKGELHRVYTGHFSKVTSLTFHYDDKYFLSSGRDKVIILWDSENISPLKTVPVYETLESVISLPKKFKIPNFKCSGDDGIYVATAGDKGLIRIWNLKASKEIYAQSNTLVNKSAVEGGLSIVKLLYNSTWKAFAVISADQNIILHDIKTFECLKQFVGFSDEILDVIYVGKDDSHLAVATNSIDIKLYENASMNCQLLKGHTDIVVALNKSNINPNLIISSGKDNTVRLWLLSDVTVTCVGIGMRHTGSVGSVAFSQMNTKFAVSVSQDMCLKIWEIPDKLEANTNLLCTHTEIAHQKDINCVTVSPNDKIIATCSQDKTVKLWNSSLALLGVLRGHKRGVWCVKFSPVDQVVLTSSADCSIKLWSINELNCLKTFEGHDASVLRLEFVTNGMQFLSAGADGLVKLFSIKTSECTSTLSEHSERIWTLALRKDERQFVTGGSDSVLIKWKDVTEEKQLERIKQQEEFALQEQQLQNYLQSDQLLKALLLALCLDRPMQVLKIVQTLIKKGETGLADTINELRDDQKEVLFKCAVNWNTNSRNCHPAQLVLNILLNELQTGKFRPTGLAGMLEGALPYTERHFKRLSQLMQDLHFINYTINSMQPHARVTG